MRFAGSFLPLAAVALALTVSCSTPASLDSPDTTTSPAARDRFGAPEVTRPREGGPLAAEPCRLLLSGDEIAALGLGQSGRQRELLGVQECTWRTADREELSLYIDTGRDLLVDTYRTRRGDFFVPRDVEGMPAVRQKSGTGEINICTVTTGLGSSQALESTWVGTSDARPGNDACESAEQASALVIRKLPPAS